MLLSYLNELKYFSVNFFYVFLALKEQLHQWIFLIIAKKCSYTGLTATLIYIEIESEKKLRISSMKNAWQVEVSNGAWKSSIIY